MSRSADCWPSLGHVDRARPEISGDLVPSVAIEFYGPDAAIQVPMPEAKDAVAKEFFERVKGDVIEAQRHNDRYVAIRPFGRAGDVLILDPSTIKQVALVISPASGLGVG